MPHAVYRLRAERLARAVKPLWRGGGPKTVRCLGCRVIHSHCLCAIRPVVPTRAGICLLMADIEPLKPSNTGWLIAEVVADTFAYSWARTSVDPRLLVLLADPQWQPYVVFPGEFVSPERVVSMLLPDMTASESQPKRPLFVLLDGTWAKRARCFAKALISITCRCSVFTLISCRTTCLRDQQTRPFLHLRGWFLCLDLAGEPHATGARCLSGCVYPPLPASQKPAAGGSARRTTPTSGTTAECSAIRSNPRSV